MTEFKDGVCRICKTETKVRIIVGKIRDLYIKIVPREEKNIIKVCFDCFIILAKKYSNDEEEEKRQSSTLITSTTNSLSSSLPTLRSPLQNSFPTTDNSSLFTKTNNAESAVSSQHITCDNHNVVSNPNVLDYDSSDSTNTNNGLSTAYHQKPGPLSKKRKRNEKIRRKIVVINEISSDEDDDLINPGVRCPNVQPLIKKRRTPYEPLNFGDHDAPIFNTSHITGG